jgi:hypothetical protein
MLGDGGLAFAEFVMQEPLPLASIHRAILEFLRDADDVVLFGAQAVNAYVDEPRMTHRVDVASTRAAEVAEELRERLNTQFQIAMRVREIGAGRGYRLYQIQKPKNRHLVDVRAVAALPPARRIGGILVVEPEELIAGKLIAFQRRQGTPKSGTDWRDLAVLLLAFPELKTESGPVRQRLEANAAEPAVIAAWESLVAQAIEAERDQDEF